MFLEQEMKGVEADLDNLRIKSEELEQHNIQLEQELTNVHWEKEKLIEAHTLETGELRKQITALREQIESPVSVPSQPAYSEFTDFSDLEGLTMNTDWENNFVLIPGVIEHDQKPPPVKAETTMVLATRRKDAAPVLSVSDGSDKPVASGLLLMLLLYGAFVASRSTGAASPPIPRMSDEVRAASTVILNNVLKDAGSHGQAQPNLSEAQQSHAISGMDATPTVDSWMQPNGNKQMAGNTMFSIQGSSSLDSLSAQLMNPTKEQEAEAAFGLTAAQYNSLHSADYNRRSYTAQSEDESGFGNRRKNLAETLQSMDEDARGNNAAEVYTRSLLWNQIPAEVVREFRKLVSESSIESGGGK
jgi:hypothetical protein